jgi:hypothetical protein
VDLRLALRAGALQGLLVGVTFLVLVLLPLPEGFFRSYGWLAGPSAWLVCALATARILRLDRATGIGATVAGGAVAVVVGSLHHDLGTLGAVVAFGIAAGALGARRGAVARR